MDAAPLDELLRHGRFARGVARAILGDEHLAEDALQETWLAAMRHPPRTLSATWIGTVVRNAALRLSRGESRRCVRERAAAIPEATAPEWRPEQQAILREVIDAVLSLEEPYRSTVLLRFYEGAPPREIASRHGVAVSTVNSRLQRAIAQLRERLDSGSDGKNAWAGALLVLARERAPDQASPVTCVTRLAVKGAVMSMKVKALVVCAAVLVAAVVTWKLAADDAPHPKGRETAAVEPPAEARVAPPPERKRPERAAEESAVDAAAVAQKSAGTAPADASTVVEGRVTGPGGTPVSGGFAYVAAETDGVRRVLVRADLGPDGAFSLKIPNDASRDGLDADVGALATGFSRNAQTVRLRGGETQRVEIRLERGLWMAGVVTTEEGAPVRDLPLLVQSSPFVQRVVTDGCFDTDALLANRFDAAVQWARTTTDALGRFSVEGLAPGGYALFTEAAAWILRTEEPVPAGTEDARILAIPARSAVVRVKSVTTGAPVACEISLTFASTSAMGNQVRRQSFSAPTGAVTLRWAKDEDTYSPGEFPQIEEPPEIPKVQNPGTPETGEGAGHPKIDEEELARARALAAQAAPPRFDISIMAEADGFHTRVLPLDPSGAGITLLDVELDPVNDATVGRLRLEVVDSRGALVDDPLEATIHATLPDHPQPTTSRISKEGPGRYVLSASPGKWRLLLTPKDAPLSDASAQPVVDLVAGGSADLRIVMPDTGFLVIRRAKGAAGAVPVPTMAANAEGSSIGRTLEDQDLKWRVLPGTWRIRFGTGPDAKVRAVVVKAFEETVVELEP